jgi:hypothetical protein
MKRLGIASAVLGLVVCAVALLNSHSPTALAESTPIDCCNLKVAYELDLGRGEHIGTSGPTDFQRIEFHENYLVLKTKTGEGQVIPISQIRTFRWEK